MSSETTLAVNELFASHGDEDLCLAVESALSTLIQNQGDHIIDDWPRSWVAGWIVGTYTGIWEGEGIGSLWQCNQDHLELLIQCYTEIGVEHTADFVSRSLEAAGRENLLSERYTNSEDYKILVNQWNSDTVFYTQPIISHLGRFLRRHRMDFTDLLDALEIKLHDAQ